MALSVVTRPPTILAIIRPTVTTPKIFLIKNRIYVFYIKHITFTLNINVFCKNSCQLVLTFVLRIFNGPWCTDISIKYF